MLVAVIFANGTRTASWALPTEQHGVWVVPTGPKVTFLFRYITKLVITLAAPQGGRTFYISLRTPDAEVTENVAETGWPHETRRDDVIRKSGAQHSHRNGC
eukprot:Skav221002  [mRNA]  locus=scaffold1846:52746:56907:+ [translate_table: standard]